MSRETPSQALLHHVCISRITALFPTNERAFQFPFLWCLQAVSLEHCHFRCRGHRHLWVNVYPDLLLQHPWTGLASLIFFLSNSLLVYNLLWVLNFVLEAVILLNLFISSIDLVVEYFGFPWHCAIPSEKRRLVQLPFFLMNYFFTCSDIPHKTSSTFWTRVFRVDIFPCSRACIKWV